MTTYFGANCSDANGPNDGVRCTITMPATPPTGAFWISEYSSAGVWGQVGIDFNGRPFFEAWKDGQLLNKPTSFGLRGKALSPGDHVFEMSLQAKTKWHFMVDGKSQGAWDLAAVDAPSSNIVACCENGDGSVPVTLSNILLRRNGVWMPVSQGAAEAIGDGYNPTIGVYGHLQDSTLPPGAVRIGGPGNIGYGTPLW